MTASGPPDYRIRNRAHWTRANSVYTAGRAPVAWGQSHIAWGVWGHDEDSIHALPDVRGRDVIELGCGTAYFGAWLKKRGARRVVGIDITPAQLETADMMNRLHGMGLELIEGDAEAVPLPDASFDLAVSEYGASIWCDPYRWIPEAARLLRRGGELVFLRNSTLAVLCSPDEGSTSDRLVRPQRHMNRIDWQDDGPTTEFHIGTGDMVQLLRRTGFQLLDLASYSLRSMPSTTPTTRGSAPNGPGAGRPRRSGGRASSPQLMPDSLRLAVPGLGWAGLQARLDWLFVSRISRSRFVKLQLKQHKRVEPTGRLELPTGGLRNRCSTG